MTDKVRYQNDFLFIGAIADAKQMERLNSLGCNISTGYNVQRKMMEGLEKLGIFVDSITAHVSPPFSKKNLIVDFKSPNRNDHVTDVSVRFVNLPFLDKLTKAIQISIQAKKWIQNKQDSCIFVYSLTSSFLFGAVAAKKKNKKCKLVAIVPDLPEYMSNNLSKIYRILKKIDRRIINKCLREFDAFVLFSEAMKEKLPIDNKPYTVVEGVIKKIDRTEYFDKVEKKALGNNKIIMLSGNLDREEGILSLLEAFSSIKDPDYRLWLTGSGNSIDLIHQYAKRDNRIIYFGYIDSYEKFSELQQKAHVFALMVPPTNEKSAYYFPSKLMEYLATGGLVACHKLKCIPKEYDDYLEYFQESTLEIQHKLVELCEMNSEVYRAKAIERYEFLKSKEPEAQMRKVVALLKCIDINY